MPSRGTLFLIPNVIAEDTQHQVIPAQTKQRISEIKHFLAENVRTARRYFSGLQVFTSVESLSFNVLDKNTREEELEGLMAPVMAGENLGVVTESGCPGIADPGMLAVRYAHRHSVRVIPLVGPSSVLLALMASGLSGQSFAFHGYLPIEEDEALRKIKELEKESSRAHQTQIVMDTPYRNTRFAKHLFKALRLETELCIAIDITGASESVITKRVRDWKAAPVVLPKKPALFLFLGQGTSAK